uniref:Ankyrin repeat domain-containing protein 45 n=1 Tax=Denticeps clupeoides TaxID=299321 RepID=A0AAY4AE18_9TELE
MLGRSSVVRELVQHGARVNAATARGYSPLHCCAAWGHLDTTKTLVELGADMQSKTFIGERPVEVALRYSQQECVDYFTWAEAKQSLQSYIAMVENSIVKPERAKRKLNREDKNICLTACSETTNWMQTAENPNIKDFDEQRKLLEEAVTPILTKLTHQGKS